MTRYIVKERRSYDARYLIEAEDEADAKNLRGEILAYEDDATINSWADHVLSIEETDAEEL